MQSKEFREILMTKMRNFDFENGSTVFIVHTKKNILRTEQVQFIVLSKQQNNFKTKFRTSIHC